MTFRTNFLTQQHAQELVSRHGTPLYVYSREKLISQAKQAFSVAAPFGLTIRYAMKANPHADILQVFKEYKVMIDASSAYEVEKALAAGFAPNQILLTSQQLAPNLDELLHLGIQFNATSLRQLEEYGKIAPNTQVTVRLNPGIGSGHSAKTNVGGITSSFGIWHEYIPEIQALVKRYNLKIHRLHTHIGSGTDPDIWQNTIKTSLDLVKHFTDVTTLNLGGGFKVARMDNEVGADMAQIGERLTTELQNFALQTGRQLHLEIEPGTFLVANAGILIAQVEDIVDTGSKGYTFLKLNTGLNDILRPSFYAAQHPIDILTKATSKQEYVVVGHNCESGDLLTPAPDDPEKLQPRLLQKSKIGDIVLIGGAGAYCASMGAHGYNSFPSAKELLV